MLSLLFVCVVSVLLLEAIGYAYLRFSNSEADFKAKIQRTLVTADSKDIAVSQGMPGPDVPDALTEHMLHPYLGFVRNPDLSRHVFNRLVVKSPVNEYGFFGPPPRKRQDAGGPLVVGLFGGSVAAELVLFARDELVAGLVEAQPELSIRGVEIVSIALGGMKQPQQILALEYLLALGLHFDIVVNLDGFNEAVLPLIENVPLGVSPFFPRAWTVYAMGSPDTTTSAIISRLVAARTRLEARRSLFSRPVFRNSHFILALWDLVLGRAEARVSRIDAELRQHFESEGASTARESGPAFRDPTPNRVLAESAAVWKRTSLQMWHASKSHGIHYLHMLQPNQYLPGTKPLTPWEELNAIAGPDVGYRRGVESGYPYLLSEGKELAALGAPFVDLTRVFEEETGPIYRDRCCHHTSRGYALLARAITNELDERGMLQTE
jgi:hypothetical protein